MKRYEWNPDKIDTESDAFIRGDADVEFGCGFNGNLYQRNLQRLANYIAGYNAAMERKMKEKQPLD